MRTLLAIILLAMLVAACSQSQQQPPAQPPQDQPGVQPPTPQQESQTGVQAQPEPRKENPEVVKYLQRNDLVKSYSFAVALLPDKRGAGVYYVKGDKIRIEPVRELQRSADYDVIFLDMTAKTAAGYCLPRQGCVDENYAIPLSYDDWIIVLPSQWLEQIRYGTRTTGFTFYDKPVHVIRYQADGKYYEVYIDNYFGYPQRVAISTDERMTNIIGGYEYRQMAFNTVKDSDLVHVDSTV
jgi:hypothetical protein